MKSLLASHGFFRKLFFAATATAASFAGVSSLTAQSLEIQFLGADLVFDGVSIFDAATPDGGGGILEEGDPLDAVTFTVDDVLVAPVLTEDITLDVNFDVDLELPTGPSPTTTQVSGPGIFDLLTGDGSILLNVEEVTVSFIDLGLISFVFGANVDAEVVTQSLPFGLEVDETLPILISFSVQVDPDTLTDDGSFITGFEASGTGEIIATLPEPGTAMLTLAASGLMLMGRRRQR